MNLLPSEIIAIICKSLYAEDIYRLRNTNRTIRGYIDNYKGALLNDVVTSERRLYLYYLLARDNLTTSLTIRGIDRNDIIPQNKYGYNMVTSLRYDLGDGNNKTFGSFGVLNKHGAIYIPYGPKTAIIENVNTTSLVITKLEGIVIRDSSIVHHNIRGAMIENILIDSSVITDVDRSNDYFIGDYSFLESIVNIDSGTKIHIINKKISSPKCIGNVASYLEFTTMVYNTSGDRDITLTLPKEDFDSLERIWLNMKTSGYKFIEK